MTLKFFFIVRNKIEVVHGAKFRVALENMLARMKTGRSDAGFNRQKDPITKSWDEWVNDSVGAIMFLNGRSAVLQTISWHSTDLSFLPVAFLKVFIVNVNKSSKG